MLCQLLAYNVDSDTLNENEYSIFTIPIRNHLSSKIFFKLNMSMRSFFLCVFFSSCIHIFKHSQQIFIM